MDTVPTVQRPGCRFSSPESFSVFAFTITMTYCNDIFANENENKNDNYLHNENHGVSDLHIVELHVSFDIS